MIEVVIPAYNAGLFLRETLLSVASQTLLPARVTVVDDNSADDTVAVALACAQQLAARLRIEVIPNAGPRGPSAARNTGIRRSQAEWIALLDADDQMEPGHLETLNNVARAADDVVLAFGDSIWFYEDRSGARRVIVESFFGKSGVASLPATEILPGCLTLNDGTFSPMLRHGLFGTSACLFQRDAALRAGLFDESMMFNEDTDFFLRIALQGRCAFTRRFVTRKRHHDDNLSQHHNHLRFVHGIALTHLKLRQRTGELRLTSRQAIDVESALRRSLTAYLYDASLTGMRGYRQAAAFAHAAGRGWMALHPRHLIRAFYFTFAPPPKAMR